MQPATLRLINYGHAFDEEVSTICSGSHEEEKEGEEVEKEEEEVDHEGGRARRGGVVAKGWWRGKGS